MASGIKRDMKRVLLVVSGALLLAVSIKIFARAGGFVPGGISGLSLIHI